MRFCIDCGSLAFVVASAPVQARDFDSKQPLTRDGKPVFSLTLLVMDGEDSAPIRVKVVGDPGLSQGQPVRVRGLVMNRIARDGGMSWWTVEGIEAAGPSPVADGGAAGRGAEKRP